MGTKMKDDEELEKLFAKMSPAAAKEVANQNSPSKMKPSKKTATKNTKKTK